ncbi:argininosuccinate lyase [Pseudomonas sp. CCI3.2]|uniref:argininosuccinate lyase n=1 Tax=unclassified Pseudomonas TaxID=196821 RepID=UPI002AC8E9E0|nr:MULTISPECIES: argininosuccinate lyase [unclassified Pseudomonas]MEB0076869.1 argininosuccinate lyase [Pseudomonas sp. MH10out]MEB0103284.1 argininosuccinate lyase [Pseudomonas sp. CCI3.2]MEB0129692.1 argininosuccinate lyase [Pseudomonas sp. CCI2.4]MEB0156633.1 argininosuccinate lyase [Pseudomonas sp. AH2 (2023)]MEB0165819.1 argininosuccinate lyase [Pseudomonas sp. CCC4.4]
MKINKRVLPTLPFRLAMIPLLMLAAGLAQAADKKEPHDNFYFLGEMNKASTVMVIDTKIVPPELGKKIVAAVDQVIVNGNKPGAERPADYLKYEPLILAIAGPDGSRMHSGRSRQDILSTTRRLMQRERVLNLLDEMNKSKAEFLKLAEDNIDTIVPAYTNGVQAQPITYAHYLLGFTSVFDRDATRFKEAYARLNMSPLGSGALGTSSFPIDRKQLAALLGFDGVVENSYDAAQLGALDTGIELTGISSSAALTIGLLVQDIHTQYHQPYPWIMITEGKLTGTSSIMPQKRNPYGLNLLRLQASDVVGGAMTYQLEAHNVTPGMPDYKRDQVEKTLDQTAMSFTMLADLLSNLQIDKARALEEVDADYSTTTELADMLQRDSDVPFRVGHHFASDLVTYGRLNKMKPADIPFSEVQRIYGEALKAFNFEHAQFPLTQAQFRTSLTAQNMIASSKGLGGPQRPEVERMLAAEKASLIDDQNWVKTQQQKLTKASADLDAAFHKAGQ